MPGRIRGKGLKKKEVVHSPEYGELKGIAIGVMHFTPAEFGEMEPRDFFLAYKAYNETEFARMRFFAEFVRLQTYRVMGPQLAKKYANAQDYWPMPWDEKKDQQNWTEDERKKSITELLEKLNYGQKS